MQSFLLVLFKHRLHPATIFKFAFDYYEIRIHPKKMKRYFLSWCEVVDKKQTMVLEEVPQFVENYCLDVMAGRAKITYYQQLKDKNQKGGKRE